jgi:hypothetical protein
VYTCEELRVLLVDHVGQITAIVEDHVERFAIGESSERLLDTPVILLLGLALPSVNGDASNGDGGGGMVLGGKDILKSHTSVNLTETTFWMGKRLTQEDQET